MEESIRSTGGTIISYLRNILGTYTPTDPTSMAGADWEYIIGGLALVVTIYCIFRLVYVIFK